jgi:hypothetical protein
MSCSYLSDRKYFVPSLILRVDMNSCVIERIKGDMSYQEDCIRGEMVRIHNLSNNPKITGLQTSCSSLRSNNANSFLVNDKYIFEPDGYRSDDVREDVMGEFKLSKFLESNTLNSVKISRNQEGRGDCTILFFKKNIYY